MVPLHIKIPADLKSRLAAEALFERRTLTALVIKMLEDGLGAEIVIEPGRRIERTKEPSS